MAKVEVKFQMEKATKNTIRFEEKLANELDAPKIGTIYVPKSTLGAIGWEEGKDIKVCIDVAK